MKRSERSRFWYCGPMMIVLRSSVVMDSMGGWPRYVSNRERGGYRHVWWRFYWRRRYLLLTR